MLKQSVKDKHYSETTRKLHLPCPYCKETGINIHVVVKNGYCYRSGQCMILKCKFNRLQSDVKTILSLTW